MTDFLKVTSYYSKFNEWGRLDSLEGKLEYDLCLPIVLKYLSKGTEILDLGGGPGRYTIELAQMGYSLHLADLSKELLEQAKERIAELKVENVKSINQVNAIDLSLYKDNSFDAVLLFGPIYHLTNITERISCIKEVYRVLKKDGLVIASFIPYLTGAIGVATRMFYFPDQVAIETLNRVFSNGIFNNNADRGFQEGYYPTSKEIVKLFGENGFSKILLRSIRGWGANKEEQIYKLKVENPKAFEAVIELINKTADDPSIIETGGQAIFVGKKINDV